MTQKLAVVPFLEIDSPAAWDRRISATDDPLGLLALVDPTLSPIHARRYLQLHLATGDDRTLLAALRLVDSLEFRGNEGMRMRALACLSRYDEIKAMPLLVPASLEPLAIENIMESEMILSDVASHAGDKMRALAHIHGAQLMASALGMTYRMQWLRIEEGRLLTLAGKPASHHIIDAMQLAPMSGRRQRWVAQTLAESYLAEGEFRRAFDLLDEDRGPLWHFAAALLGRVEALETLPQQTGHYAELATAVWAIRQGQPFTLTACYDFYPQRGYAEVLRARSMVANPGLKYQAASALSGMNVADLTQDQRVYLAAMKLSACAENGDVLISQAAILELSTALNALTTLEYILPFVQAISPNRTALASMVPGAHPELALRISELPMLVGEHVTFRNQTIKLPGKASGGISMVRAAFYGESVALHHEAAKRMRQALIKQDVKTELVNVGYLLRCLKRLRDAALPEQRGPWQAAILNTLELIDSRALRSDLSKDLTSL